MFGLKQKRIVLLEDALEKKDLQQRLTEQGFNIAEAARLVAVAKVEQLQEQLRRVEEAAMKFAHESQKTLEQQNIELIKSEEKLVEAAGKLHSCETELGLTNIELDKAREELRVLRQEAVERARAASLGQDLNKPFVPLRFADEVDSERPPLDEIWNKPRE